MLASRLHSVGRKLPLSVEVVGGPTDLRNDFVSGLRGLLTAIPSEGPSQNRNVEVSDLGFADQGRLRSLLRTSDAGLTRNSADYMSKSSSLASMLEHGLPVWAPLWRGEPLELPFRPEQVHGDLLQALSAPRLDVQSMVPLVVDTFLADLADAL